MVIWVLSLVCMFCFSDSKLPSVSESLTQLTSDTFHPFIARESPAGHLAVVYFYKHDIPGLKNFIAEVQRASYLVGQYNAQFALVDCSKYGDVGFCNVGNSYDRVYMYRGGRVLMDIPRQSMFDSNSIVANVLQVVLLLEVPILQSVEEFEDLLLSSRGRADVIFSYQTSVGTYAHRVFMEAVYPYRTKYRFGITTEQSPVGHLPDFSSGEDSAVWLLRCRHAAVEISQPCKSIKYPGSFHSDNLSQFFRVLDLTFIHDIGQDGDYNPYESNGIHSVFIFYNRKTAPKRKQYSNEVLDVFYSQLGIITVNVDEVDAAKFGFQSEWKLPAVAVKLVGQETSVRMSDGDVPVRFVAEVLASTARPLQFDSSEQNTFSNLSDRKERLMIDAQEVGKQDDEVAEAGYLLKREKAFVDVTHYKELARKAFFDIVVDARCQVLMTAYDEASQILTNTGLRPLAVVNCFDWTDVCQSVNVSVYPSLYIYRGMDSVPVSYQGVMSTQSIVSTMKLLSATSPLILASMEQVEHFFTNGSDFVVFGGFHSPTDQESAVFNHVAHQFHGKIQFGVSYGELALLGCSRFSLKSNCIVILPRMEGISPFSSIPSDTSAAVMMTKIQQFQLMGYTELTGTTFQQRYTQEKPIVITFIESERTGTDQGGVRLWNVMKTLLLDNSQLYQLALFTWTDVSRSQAGFNVLKHHISQPRPEELLVINRQKGTVHHFTETFTREAVYNWLSQVLLGAVHTDKRLSDMSWRPRVMPYDFLASIDEEQANPGAASRHMNTHGLELLLACCENFESSSVDDSESDVGDLLGQDADVVRTSEEQLLDSYKADKDDVYFGSNANSIKHVEL